MTKKSIIKTLIMILLLIGSFIKITERIENLKFVHEQYEYNSRLHMLIVNDNVEGAKYLISDLENNIEKATRTIEKSDMLSKEINYLIEKLNFKREKSRESIR